MITYNQLRTFLAVARAGSLTRAARELRASQPTVSLQLRALRRSLGAILIERPDNGFRLTAAGEKLRRYAEETLGGLHTLQQDIQALDGTLAGPLAVGLTFLLSGHVLPPALSRFRGQFPGVDLQVHVDLPEPLFDGLAGNTLDVACYLRVRTRAGLTVEPVATEEFVIFASPAHPLAGRRRVTPEELSEHPFVVLTLEPFRELLESKLCAAGVKPRLVVETRNHDAVKQMVEGNAGYSILIRPLVADELARGQLVTLNLEGPPILGEIVVAYATRSVVPPLVAEFVRFLRAELAAERGGPSLDGPFHVATDPRRNGSPRRRKPRSRS
jgi:LysR family transcriptional regulator, low CO2-responsive transcriptional regulator